MLYLNECENRSVLTHRRDQELRFTVHDSPDYYKLKCSVFNDDKKTDLIGEAWIDLSEVIKLGGGQSDQWQQLSFKGKYAGDIRVELTFYDTREKPQEKEKKKPKERHEASPSGSATDLSLSGPRSLGPREIKRRPLPANPGAPATTRSKSITIGNLKPEAPPKIPLEPELVQLPSVQQPQVVHAPVPIRPRGSSTSPQPQQFPQPLPIDPSDRYHVEESSQPFAHYQQGQLTQMPHFDQRSHPREPSWHEPVLQQRREPDRHIRQNSRPVRVDTTEPQQPSYQLPESTYPNEDEIWHSQRPQSIHTHSAPITPLTSSPAHRPAPSSAGSDGQIVRYHQNQWPEHGASRMQQYTDSPLRQSISHHDVDLPLVHQPSVPPPLPPKHRDPPPRRPKSEYPPAAYIPEPLRIGGNRSSVPDRSPLQSLEDNYDSHRRERLADPHTPQRHSMYEPQHEQYHETPQQHETSGQQLELYGRRRTYEEQPRHSDSQLQQQPQQYSNSPRQNSHEVQSPYYNPQMINEPQPRTTRDGYHSGYDDGYQPFVEDAPPSPGLQPAVARKAVGAQPKKLNGIPFGPDAYDVLNPASSPVTNEQTIFQTADQAKEAQRLKEVEKIRDIGPIIGNDGRIIDPSDHLPSDTWAPEPERKNRKPEHVVHIRTKNDPRRPAGARGSPLVVRHGGPQSHNSSPAVEPASSPATRTTPNNFIGSRNRLQKSMPTPTRQLQNHPYSSPMGPTASSPALASSPQNMYEDGRPSYNRQPSSERRAPNNLTRPALSEYQVPAGNSYTPRSRSYERKAPKAIEAAYETPTKTTSYQAYSSPAADYERGNSQQYRRNSYDDRNGDFGYDGGHSHRAPAPQVQQMQHYDDALAAEMSLIDIGPSRHTQSQSYHAGALVRSRGRW